MKAEGLRARRAQAEKGRSEMENRERLGMKKQQLFQAVEELQGAAGEWLIARAGQRAVQGDEEEPEWLMRAGKELEQMLRQWQLQQEE
eukprot:3742950-Prymnesium_polylepis.1